MKISDKHLIEKIEYELRTRKPYQCQTCGKEDNRHWLDNMIKYIMKWIEKRDVSYYGNHYDETISELIGEDVQFLSRDHLYQLYDSGYVQGKKLGEKGTLNKILQLLYNKI